MKNQEAPTMRITPGKWQVHRAQGPGGPYFTIFRTKNDKAPLVRENVEFLSSGHCTFESYDEAMFMADQMNRACFGVQKKSGRRG